MTTWNYRLVRETLTVPLCGKTMTEDRIHVIEAYYDADANLIMWCPAGGPEGESRADVAANLRAMLEATERPILHATTLPNYDPQGGIAAAST